MKNNIKSFSTFSETKKREIEHKLREEVSIKRTTETQRFADLLAEFEISNISELDEEKRTQFFAALVGETEELENEGNAFGAAVKKAKEEGEDEFEVDGETYKVEEAAQLVAEKKSLNEAVQVEDKRTAKKVVTQLNRIFTKQLPDLQQMGKEGIYGCVKYFLDYSMTDANFHTERAAVVKTIKNASIPGIEVKLPGLGGYHAKISGGRIKEILHQYAGQISKAAEWSGQGIVEGCALYLSQFHKDDATATAMINKFNAQFEGEDVRVDVAKKTDLYDNVNEANVTSSAAFKSYAFKTLKQAFGERFDKEKAQKIVDGILSKVKNDYGVAVGMLKNSMSFKRNKKENEK